MKEKTSKNLWDIKNFSSVDNKLPVYPRLKGNFEFDGKSPLKPIDMPSVNENRFLTKVDYIEKKTPYIQMDKYLPRDNSFL